MSEINQNLSSSEIKLVDTINKSKNRLFEEIITVIFITAALVVYLLGYSSFIPLLVITFGALWNFFARSNQFIACIFGLIVCVLYAYVAIINGLFSHAFLHVMFYYPMQLIVYYKERNSNDVEIKSDKHLSLYEKLFIIVSGIMMLFIVGFVSSKIDNQIVPYFDAFSAVFLAVSVFLQISKYREYWLVRMLATIMASILWISVGIMYGWNDGAISMAMLFLMYFIVDSYLFFKWNMKSFKKKPKINSYSPKKRVSVDTLNRIEMLDNRNESKKVKSEIKSMYDRNRNLM